MKIKEEHGDTYYWGDQPHDKEHKISTGYTGTVKLKEVAKRRLRELIKQTIREYQQITKK
jgi:hypothetical protein